MGSILSLGVVSGSHVFHKVVVGRRTHQANHRAYGLLVALTMLAVELAAVNSVSAQSRPVASQTKPRSVQLTGGETVTPPTEVVVAPDHPLAPAITFARESRESLKAVRDYTALFNKRELVGKRMVTQTMELKLREQPFSVYFHFRGPEAGREVLYVDGANKGKLLVHEDGIKAIAGTLALSLDSPEVVKENRYPITRVGMAKMLDAVLEQWEDESRYGEVDLKYFPNARLGVQECVVYQSTHPTPRRQFKFHKTTMYFDKATNLPVRVEQHGWPTAAGAQPPLIEEYTYSNIKTNVGLSDRDFDKKNRAYRF